MAKSGHLCATGYDDMERANQVRGEIISNCFTQGLGNRVSIRLCSTPNQVVGVVRVVVALLGLSMWFLLAGCQTLGPTALGVGRGAYNEVIARTSSEQTLGLLVRLRYSDPIGLLAVSSVTASLKFSAEAKSEAGFGPKFGGTWFRSSARGRLRGQSDDLLHTSRRTGVSARVARASHAGDTGAGAEVGHPPGRTHPAPSRTHEWTAQ